MIYFFLIFQKKMCSVFPACLHIAAFYEGSPLDPGFLILFIVYLLYLPISIFEVVNFYSALLARSAVIKFPHKPQPDVYGDIVFAMCSCELGLIG